MKKGLNKLLSIFSVFTILALQFSVISISAAETTSKPVYEWLTAEEAGVLSPEEYAYSMAVVGDTQSMNWQDCVKGTDYMYQMYTYIADTAEEKKLQYVMGLGDITDNNNDAEWQYSVESIKQMDGKVGYSLIEGNHDNAELNGGKGVIDGMNTYYGTDSTYANQYFAKYGNSARNTAHAFKAGNQKWLVFALEIRPSDAVKQWATNLMKQMSDYNVIITTHIYLNGDGSYMAGGNPTTYAQDIYEGLVANNDNVKMVFCGHVNPGNGSIVQVTSTNAAGDTVYEFEIDPQSMDYSNSNGLGYTPYGMVAYYYFDENGDVIDLQYYSTVKDMYMNIDLHGVARKYDINAISSEVDDIPDAIGATDKENIDKLPYMFTAYSGDTLPIWQNAGITSANVDGISPYGKALAITEIPYSESGAWSSYDVQFDRKPETAEGLEGICFWLKTGNKNRTVYFSSITFKSDYTIRFIKSDGSVVVYSGDSHGNRLYLPKNFEGWVFFSFDNFETQIDPTKQNTFHINTDQGSGTTAPTYYIDNIGYYYASAWSEITHLMDSESAVTESADSSAVITNTSGISDQGNELRVNIGGGISTGSFKVEATNTEFALPENGYIGFWTKNNGYANYYKLSAIAGETVYTASNTSASVLLVNDDTAVSSAKIAENGIIVPAYFEGWVLVPYTAFDNSPAGIVMDSFCFDITKNGYTNSSYFVIDSVVYAENLASIQNVVGSVNDFDVLLDAEGRANEIIDYKYTATNATLANGISPYGRAVKVVTPAEKNVYPQIFLKGNGKSASNASEVEGFAFWMKSVDSKYETTFGLYVNNKYLFVEGGNYFLVPNGAAATEKTFGSAEKVEVPSGFEGWVVVPKESCSFTVTQIDLINIAAWDPRWQLDCTFYFDSFGCYTNERFMVDARAMENFTVVSNNERTWDSGKDFFTIEKGDSVSSNGQNAIKITAMQDINSWQAVELSANGQVLNTLDGYGGFAMWVKNEDTENAATVALYQRNSLNIHLNQIYNTYYLISSKGEITSALGQELTIPAGFEGWIVLPKEKFGGDGLWDSSIITRYYMAFSMKSGTALQFNSLGFYRDLEKFKADAIATDLGDVNADYSIDSEDLTLLRKHLLGCDEETMTKCPDVNIDTYVDVSDLVALKKLLVKVS